MKFRTPLIFAIFLSISAGGVALAVTKMQSRPLPLPHLLTEPVSSRVGGDEIRRGQYLVLMGDCASCHTPQGGQAFAGGLGLSTPFGVVYSTNLTSDRETGIGSLTPDQFYAALHYGIGPKGAEIYPAMPYTAFTRVTRADSDAMLAYLKTTPAVHSKRPPNRLIFPLNHRSLVGGWNLLFLRAGTFASDPGKSAAWNRGSYIVNGLGHCGSCHTPKNLLGGDKRGKAFQGGNLNDWVAPDLTGNSRTGLGAWSVDDIVAYLKLGRNRHANAGGPMADVVTNSTSLMKDQDLRAIATYLKDLPASPSTIASIVPDSGAMRKGREIYSDACASCHMQDGVGQPSVFPPIGRNAMLQQGDPSGLIHLILAGSRSAPTPTRPTALSMPSFAWKLTDQQVADVSTFIRNSWGNRAAPVDAQAVSEMRKRLKLDVVRRTDNSGDHS